MKTQLVFNFLFAVLVASSFSCKKGADDPKEAAARLTAIPKWHIDEILVNDAITFSDGKMKKQFGGVDFERYMETVQFEKSGFFAGYFKGDARPMTLRWRINSPDIIVSSADTTVKAGSWTILPADVAKDAFSMKTQSTAYDYPRMTKIELKFKAAE